MSLHRPATAVRPRGLNVRTENASLNEGEDGCSPSVADSLSVGATQVVGSPETHISASFSRPAGLTGLKCVNTLSGHYSGIRAIAVHNDRIFTGSYDNTIKVTCARVLDAFQERCLYHIGTTFSAACGRSGANIIKRE